MIASDLLVSSESRPVGRKQLCKALDRLIRLIHVLFCRQFDRRVNLHFGEEHRFIERKLEGFAKVLFVVWLYGHFPSPLNSSV